MDKLDHLPVVRAHYEELPYPARNPLDETKRMKTTFYDCLDRINYYCYSGKKDFFLGARVLVAGGGTGDALIFIAEQLRDTNSEIVYLDFSKACMKIARERAKIRGLKNITWIHDSILNIPSLNLGAFDYINCMGVLHHLEDPNAGLSALKSVLSDDGVMTIMVYAQYGRTAVYQIQALMRIINQHESDMHAEIDNCRKVLDALPSDHWYKLSKSTHEVSDTEIYDLFLHSQDRSYTVSESYDFIESAGLKLAHLFSDSENGDNDLINPGLYIKDTELLTSIRKLELRQQQAIAEIIHGRITQHTFYVANKVHPLPSPENLEYIPSLVMGWPKATYNSLSQLVSSSNDYVNLEVLTAKGSTGFPKTPNIESFFRYMNGEKTLKGIYDAIISSALLMGGGQLSYESLGKEFKDMFSVMTVQNILLLRHQSVPAYRTSEEIQARMK